MILACQLYSMQYSLPKINKKRSWCPNKVHKTYKVAQSFKPYLSKTEHMKKANKALICACCESPIGKGQVLYGDPDTYYENKPLCESCYDGDEPVASVYLPDDRIPQFISYTRNETEGEFRVRWDWIDSGRGHYKMESDDYINLLSDAILSGHESAKMLAELNQRIQEEFLGNGINFRRIFTRTSNIFCTGYNVWIKKDPEQILMAYSILQKLKNEVGYDNPLYSTGILMDRDSLKKVKEILGGRYKIRNDGDLEKLVKEKGEGFLKEMGTEKAKRNKKGG